MLNGGKIISVNLPKVRSQAFMPLLGNLMIKVLTMNLIGTVFKLLVELAAALSFLRHQVCEFHRSRRRVGY